MEHSITEIESMTAIGTDDEPELRIEMKDGSTVVLDGELLRKFTSDLFDWVAVFDDLSLDRIERQRAWEAGE